MLNKPESGEPIHIKYELSQTRPSAQYYYSQLYERIAGLVARRARGLSNNPSQLSVLDVGCGRGEILQALSGLGFSNLVGIDFDPNCVELSSAYAETHRCSVAELEQKFPGRQFDLAICSHVLEHVETPRQLLLQLKTVTRHDLVLAVPNLGNPFKRRKRVIFENKGHVCGWDCTHLHTLLHTSGWDVDHWEKDMILLPDKARDRLPNFLVSKIEQSLLPRAHQFVFAQSLICTAKKADPK